MAFTPLDIDETVRKFWEGNTTLEEEQALRAWFAYRDVPEEYADLAAYFEMAEDDMAAPGPEFDERVLNLTVNKAKPRGGMAILRPLFRVAAVAAVAVGVFFGVQLLNPEHTDPMAGTAPATSFQQADPEVRQAFDLLKQKLSFMSRKMDESTAHTGKLNKINIAVSDDDHTTVSK